MLDFEVECPFHSKMRPVATKLERLDTGAVVYRIAVKLSPTYICCKTILSHMYYGSALFLPSNNKISTPTANSLSYSR